MATDTTPAPTSSISAPIPTNNALGPPVSGKLPPAAEAAEAVAVLLAEAVAEAVAVAVAVAVEDEVAEAVGVVGPVTGIPIPRTSGRSLAWQPSGVSLGKLGSGQGSCAKATDANSSAPDMDSAINRSSFLKESSFELWCTSGGVCTFPLPKHKHVTSLACLSQYTRLTPQGTYSQS
jgi:hypothetical protein